MPWTDSRAGRMAATSRWHAVNVRVSRTLRATCSKREPTTERAAEPTHFSHPTPHKGREAIDRHDEYAQALDLNFLMSPRQDMPMTEVTTHAIQFLLAGVDRTVSAVGLKMLIGMSAGAADL